MLVPFLGNYRGILVHSIATRNHPGNLSIGIKNEQSSLLDILLAGSMKRLGICKQKTSPCHSRAGGNPPISLALKPVLYFNATPLPINLATCRHRELLH
jgi:hypothetical protein